MFKQWTDAQTISNGTINRTNNNRKKILNNISLIEKKITVRFEFTKKDSQNFSENHKKLLKYMIDAECDNNYSNTKKEFIFLNLMTRNIIYLL